MGSLIHDIRHGIRALAKNPVFTTVAVLSLALGIGANTAIFSLLNALLLRSLPVRQPDRLVELSVLRRGDKIPFSYPMFREIDRGQRVFSGLMGWTFGAMTNVELNGELSQAEVQSVTGNYFSELGATPILGRLIAPEDANPSGGGTSPVAVLSYDFWQRRFGGAPDVAGKEIPIDGQSFTIIGVTRKYFTGMATGEPADLMIPIKNSDDRSILFVFVTGRLKDGITTAQARAQLQSFWPEVLRATVSTETPGLRRQTFLSMGLDVAPAATGVNVTMRSRFTRPLYVLMGIVGLILLATCVNLANLMLARAAARGHEMAVRVALGASRWVLARQILCESLALSISGALLGLAFAYWGSRILVTLMTQGSRTPVVFDLSPDGRVLSLTAMAAITTGILFGLAPAWHSSKEDPATALRQNARSIGASTGKLGKVLIVTQIALSLMLLLGAGLLVRSFQKLCSVDPGLEESVLAVSLYPKPGGYQHLEMNAYHRQLIERVSNIPGVISAGFADVSIATGSGWQDAVSTMADASSPGAGVMASVAMVTPGFMHTLGISLVRGRDFEWSDDEHHARIAIVSRSLADRLSPAGHAIGQRIRFGIMPELQDLEVVGVTNNARIFDLHNSAPSVIFVPALQHETQNGDLFVRTRSAPEALARSVGREIESLGHEYALNTKTIAEEISQSLVEERVIAMLAGFFAGLALLLASVGVYGVLSYAVSRRTREIGIRMALGAQHAAVIRQILGDALMLGLAGIVFGIPCGLAACRLIGSMLFGIFPGDLPTLLSTSAILLGVTLLAGYLPARRAASINPVEALRAE